MVLNAADRGRGRFGLATMLSTPVSRDSAVRVGPRSLIQQLDLLLAHAQDRTKSLHADANLFLVAA